MAFLTAINGEAASASATLGVYVRHSWMFEAKILHGRPQGTAHSSDRKRIKYFSDVT